MRQSVRGLASDSFGQPGLKSTTPELLSVTIESRKGSNFPLSKDIGKNLIETENEVAKDEPSFHDSPNMVKDRFKNRPQTVGNFRSNMFVHQRNSALVSTSFSRYNKLT